MAEGTVLSLKDGTVSVTYEFLAGQIELNPTFDQPNLAGLTSRRAANMWMTTPSPVRRI